MIPPFRRAVGSGSGAALIALLVALEVHAAPGFAAPSAVPLPPPPAASSSVPSRPPVAAIPITMLILALDELRLPPTPIGAPPAPPASVMAPSGPSAITAVPDGLVPALPAAPPALPAPPAGVLPEVAPDGAPAAPAAPAAITPARGARPWLPYVRSSAKSEPKKDDWFVPGPDLGGSYPIARPPRNYAAPTGAAPTGGPGPAIAAPAAGPAASAAPFDTTPAIPVERAPGQAQLAAAPLRRALVRMGFLEQNVLTATPDGASVQQAVVARRLTQRVLDTLQFATGQIVTASLPAAPASSSPAAPAADARSAAPFGATGELPALSPVTPAEAAAPPPPDALAGLPAPVRQALPAAVQSASRVGQTLGYRAVLVLMVVPHGEAAVALPASGAGAGERTSTYSLLLVDAQQETGDVLTFDQAGADAVSTNEAAATAGAAMVERNVRSWPPDAPAGRRDRAQSHFLAARMLLDNGDVAGSVDELNQSLALDPQRRDAYILLGDVMQGRDPAGAAAAYQHAADLNANDGSVWAKMAVGFASAPKPDWVRAIEAGRHALDLKYDSAALRAAMATAQFGRAAIFRQYDRLDSAEEAEADAKVHLDRALELAPDDPAVIRVLAEQLVGQERYADAVRMLDRIALQYPTDTRIQTAYATALTARGGRDEDAFVAWSRVWKLTNQEAVTLDGGDYRHLAEGFDQRVVDLGKSAQQLSSGVASGSLLRESALLQLTRLKEDMDAADTAVTIMRPAYGARNEAIHASRMLAADLMSQALAAHQIFLETGQDIYRQRGLELTRQAINRLNAARTAGH